MNRFCDINIELTPTILPKANTPQTLYALLRINPIKSKQQGKIPLDLRMVLDHSGSMGMPAGNGKYSCALDILKKGCQKAVDLLHDNDRLTIYVFSEKAKMILSPTEINSQNRQHIKQAIDGINLGGGTHMSTALRGMLKIKNLPNHIQRALVFTDGEVNMPSEKAEEKACLAEAGCGRRQGVPFWVYGVGTDYNEKFLRQLADASGGSYEHISKPTDMVHLFKDQVQYFQDIAVTNVELALEGIPGITMRKISRVIPDIQTYSGFQPQYFSSPVPDIDRARGLAFLLQLEVEPGFTQLTSLVDATLTYDVPNIGLQGEQQKVTIEVDFTDDPSLLRHNQNVLDVVTLQGAHDLTTLAAQQAQTGQADLATRMMQQAAQLYNQLGDDDMASNLVTLSNAVQQQGGVAGQALNTQRTLTSASARMVTKHLTNAI